MNTLRLITLFVLPLLSNLLSPIPQADSRDPEGGASFSLRSVHGTFAAVGIYGANVARALGTETFDGDGKLTGAAIVNQPGPNGGRLVTHIGLNGTYSVNADGSGKMFLTVTLPDGTSAHVVEDYLMTKTKVVHGDVLAIEMTDAQEQPSAAIEDRSLVIHNYTLREDSAKR